MTFTEETWGGKFAHLWANNPFADNGADERSAIIRGVASGEVDTQVKSYLDILVKTPEEARPAIEKMLLAWGHYKVVMSQRKNPDDFAPGEETKRKATEKVTRKQIAECINPYLEKLTPPGKPSPSPDLYVNIVMAAGRCEIGLNPLSPNPKIFGEDDQIQTLRHEIWSACFGASLYVAATCSSILREESVLILGETGTGKELVAEVLADASFMTAEPTLNSFNVAALPAEMVEAELFGYIKGYHPGAYRDVVGLIMAADKNTLLLDEIAELPLASQTKILRVLETRKVRRLGEPHEVPFDVRIVAATHGDLNSLVSEKQFRVDLLHRLVGITINTVPLRELSESTLMVIARSLIRSVVKSIDNDTQEQAMGKIMEFKDYSWPGNMRELRNVIRSLILGRSTPDQQQLKASPKQSMIEDISLPDFLNKALTLDITLKELKDDYISYAVGKLNNNKTRAADTLDFNISNFYKKRGKKNA